MMTSYELIRRLMQVDPTGQRPVMINVITSEDGKSKEVFGFVDELWIEYAEDTEEAFIVLNATDD